jgi:hypothetical protein
MIKVGYLVSYDYEYIFVSIDLIYKYSTKIFIAIDKDYLTWNGNKFEIPNSFFERIKEIDVDEKIELYFDNFYISELTPIECETRERNLLLKIMGKGWKLQLDVDEYIYDFKTISSYLKKYWYLTILPKLTPISFSGKLVTLYKKLPNGFLYIENNEKFSFITNQTNYLYTRNNNSIKNHFTNINVIHQSWARTFEEMEIKISNWGHSNDFNTEKYFCFWKTLDSNNYKIKKNIHPINPKTWDKLYFMEAKDVYEFIEKYSIMNKQFLIFIEKKKMIKALLKKIFK